MAVKTLDKAVGQEVIIWMASGTEVHGTLTHVANAYVTVRTGTEARFVSWAAIATIRIA
jgi:hypothetical protein